jgi:hypothetical protein
MKRTRNRLLSAFTICAVAVLIQTTVQPGRSQSESASTVSQKKGSVDHIPVVDYTTSDLTGDSDPQTRDSRKAKGSRYDKRLAGKTVDFITGREEVVTYRYMERRALPVGGRSVVVLGEVVDARAYLSNDKSGVYSEFTVRVEEVFTNNSENLIAVGSSIVTERAGGRVRLSSGRVVRFSNDGEDMPRPGRRYVFFLEINPQQYTIRTAYELRAGRVHPLDGKNAPNYTGSDWEGDAYEGADAAQFLIDVRNAVAQSLQEIKKEGATQP